MRESMHENQGVTLEQDVVVVVHDLEEIRGVEEWQSAVAVQQRTRLANVRQSRFKESPIEADVLPFVQTHAEQSEAPMPCRV